MNPIICYGLSKKIVFFFYKKLGLNTRINKFFIKKRQYNQLLRLKKKRITEKKLLIQIKNRIYFQKKIKTYRGIRNKLGYPCRGQRTHTNANTKKTFKI